MTEPPRSRGICLLTPDLPGHYQSYTDLLSSLLRQEGYPITVTDEVGKAVAFRGPVFILALEKFKVRAHLLILVRAIRGLRTAALVLRSREALTGRKPQTLVKRALLQMERQIPLVSMMTILPHAVLPGSPRLFRSWIHDPQVWDMLYLPAPEPDRRLADAVRARAEGRPVLLAAGLIAEYKGLEMIVALANDPDFCSRYLLVIAGPQIAGLEAMLSSVKGDCLIENRYISDGELYSLYEAADYVWAVYSPSYDQASGIFGRAVQFGRTPVIRAGSLLDDYTGLLGTEPVRVAWNASPEVVASQLARSPGRVEPLAIGKQESMASIKKALFGEECLSMQKILENPTSG